MKTAIRYLRPMARGTGRTGCAVFESIRRALRPWRLGVLAVAVLAPTPRPAAAIQASDSNSLPGRVTSPITPATPSFMSADEALDAEPEPPARVAFVIESAARDVLQQLWSESVQAKEERVACITGTVNGHVFHVTSAEPVPTETADSLHVSPGPSLAQCGPPEWSGTVHTHIATYHSHLFGGTIPQTSGVRKTASVGRPYSTFSISDRAVMGMWRARWKTEGAFCVLYTEDEAYCEYGTELNGDAFYAVGR